MKGRFIVAVAAFGLVAIASKVTKVSALPIGPICSTYAPSCNGTHFECKTVTIGNVTYTCYSDDLRSQ